MTNKDLVIKYDLMNPLANYSTEDVQKFMQDMFPKMIELFVSKDKNYGGSWQKRGLLSSQMNFERKVDRILEQFYNGTITEESNENIADTFIDNAIYSVMYLYFLSEKVPMVKEQLNNFLTKQIKDGNK